MLTLTSTRVASDQLQRDRERECISTLERSRTPLPGTRLATCSKRLLTLVVTVSPSTAPRLYRSQRSGPLVLASMDQGLVPSANVGDKWPTDRIIQFLEEYRNHPCLWDSRHRHYKSKSDRMAAETDILKKMRLQYFDLNVFRSKVRNIRNTYRQEVMKILRNSKPEAGVDGVFVPKLRWFNLADSFLRKNLDLNDVPQAQRSQEDMTSEPDVSLDETSALDFEDVKPSIDDLRHHDPSWGDGLPSATRHPPPLGKTAPPPPSWDAAGRGDDTRASDPPASTLPRVVEAAVSRVSTEFDAFGKYVSLQLQQLPLDVAVELEMEIVNLVCRRRLNLLREGTELPSGDQNY